MVLEYVEVVLCGTQELIFLARRAAERLELCIFDAEGGMERADGLRRNGEWE